MKTAQRIKTNLEILRSEILDNIKTLVLQQPDKRIELEDDRGSLVIGGDEQESIVIMSVEARTPIGHPVILMANYGIYDEDGRQPLTDYDTETLANVLEACEKATE